MARFEVELVERRVIEEVVGLEAVLVGQLDAQMRGLGSFRQDFEWGMMVWEVARFQVEVGEPREIEKFLGLGGVLVGQLDVQMRGEYPPRPRKMVS